MIYFSTKIVAKIIFIIIIFSFLVSCGNSNKKETISAEFKGDRFRNSIPLSGEVIKFDSILNPFAFHVLRDSLVLVEYKDANPKYRGLYSLKTKRKLFEFAERGKGPDEFLSARFMNNIYTPESEYIFIQDVIKKSVSKYHLDSLISSKGTCKPTQNFEFPFEIFYFSEMEDNKYVCYNSFFIEHNKYNNNNEQLFYYDVEKQEPTTMDYEYFTLNVSMGTVLISSDKEKIFVAERFRDRIHVYNPQLELQKTIIGPDFIVPKYIIEGDGMLFFKKGTRTETYDNAIITNNSMYLIYTKKQDSNFSEPASLMPVDVFQFNLEGHLMNRYVLDRFLYSISVTSDQKHLYGTTINPEGLIQLIHYQL